jgi:hypothetical protein
VQPAPKEEVSLVGSDIHFLKKLDTGSVARELPLFMSPFYWGLNALLLILWLAAGFFASQATTGDGLKGLTFRRAHRVAHAKLRATKRNLKKGKPDEFYAALATAVTEYFAGKFEIPVYAVNAAAIEEKTAGLPVDPALLSETKELFRTLDQVRFAGSVGESGQMKEIYDKADRVLTNFERLKIK